MLPCLVSMPDTCLPMTCMSWRPCGLSYITMSRESCVRVTLCITHSGCHAATHLLTRVGERGVCRSRLLRAGSQPIPADPLPLDCGGAAVACAPAVGGHRKAAIGLGPHPYASCSLMASSIKQELVVAAMALGSKLDLVVCAMQSGLCPASGSAKI
jgi:hypothetical protein